MLILRGHSTSIRFNGTVSMLSLHVRYMCLSNARSYICTTVFIPMLCTYVSFFKHIIERSLTYCLFIHVYKRPEIAENPWQ